MDPLEILERMGSTDTAPAWWPPGELDDLITAWRQATTEQWNEGNFGLFMTCAVFAIACRNARFWRRMTGRYR